LSALCQQHTDNEADTCRDEKGRHRLSPNELGNVVQDLCEEFTVTVAGQPIAGPVGSVLDKGASPVKSNFDGFAECGPCRAALPGGRDRSGLWRIASAGIRNFFGRHVHSPRRFV